MVKKLPAAVSAEQPSQPGPSRRQPKLARRRDRRVEIGIFAVAGLLLAVAAIWAVSEAHYLSIARRATGEIVDTQNRSSSDSQPVVRFTTAEGVQVEFTSNLSSASFQVGQHLAVAYLPDDPKGTASIDDAVGNYVFPLVLGVFGLLLLAFGLASSNAVQISRYLARHPLPAVSPVWIAPALLALGGVFLLGALVAADSAFHWQATTAQGTVVDFVDDEGVRYPLVSFVASNGRPHTFRASLGTNPSPYREGQHVTVYYSPADPGRADLESFSPAGVVALVLGGFAALCVIFAGVARVLVSAVAGLSDSALAKPTPRRKNRRRAPPPTAPEDAGSGS